MNYVAFVLDILVWEYFPKNNITTSRRPNKFTQPISKVHYNDFLGKQSSKRGREEVTYFYGENLFCIHLVIQYANFQEKIFVEISGKNALAFHRGNVTIMKSLEPFSRNLRKDPVQ